MVRPFLKISVKNIFFIFTVFSRNRSGNGRKSYSRKNFLEDYENIGLSRTVKIFLGIIPEIIKTSSDTL